MENVQKAVKKYKRCWSMTKALKLWGALPWGHCWSSVGGATLYEGHYFERNVGAR